MQANNLNRLSHPVYCPELVPANFWLFGHLKIILEGSSFQTAEELQETMTDILMLIQTVTFRTVFEEWKSTLLRYIKTSGEYL
jgi:hypothetical protein